MSFDAAPEAQQPSTADAAGVSDVLSVIDGRLSSLEIDFDAVADSKAEAVKAMPETTEHKRLAALAATKLAQLREFVSPDAPTLKNITLEDLEQSASLRSFILDFEVAALLEDPNPVYSFEREYSNEREKLVALKQSGRQQSLAKQVSKVDEIKAHNVKVQKEALAPEEGIDYSHA